MYKSIIIKIMFLGLCIFTVGCGKKSELKTDCVEGYSYIVEDLLAFSAESGDVYVEILQDHIVYHASGQMLMMSDLNGQNKKPLFPLETGQLLCTIGQTGDQDLLIMTKEENKDEDQYEWIEVNLTGEQKENRQIKDSSFFPKSVIKDSQGRKIVLSWDGAVFVYEDGSETGRKIEREGLVESICLDADSRVLIAENIDNVYQIVKLKEDLQNGEEKIVLNEMVAEIFAGQDEKQYFFEEDYLYCFDLNEKIMRPVLRWVDAGLDPNVIKKVHVSKEGLIYVVIENDEQCVIKKLTPITKSSENQKELILACVGLNSVLREQIFKFNNESDDYRISIRDYGEEEDPYQALNMDIITEKQFDILCMEGLYAHNYIEKGLLEDLSMYINVDDYVHAYIEAVKDGDGIYQVSPYFSIQTILGKTEDVGEKNGWTSEEMIGFLEDNLDTRGLLYYNECDLLGVFTWSGMDAYLQEDEYGKHFQRESFQNVLEFVKNYQDYALKNENNADIPATDMAYRGELLLLKGTISSGDDYRAYKAMFGSDITAKGYPMAKKAGNYMYLEMPVAICSKSSQKEAAWEFISYLLTDETQYDLKSYGFPVKRKILDQLYDEWCGNKMTEEDDLTITIEGNEKKVPYMNKKDITDLEAIIDSSMQLRTDSPELIRIVKEESSLYFQGQQSLESTGEYIENRIHTYLEEKN